MRTQNHTGIPAVYLLLRKDNKILMAERINTGYQDGSYQVPSGHVEEGELPLEAMVREAKEETGIVITKENLKFAHVGYRTKHDHTGDRFDLFFNCKDWEGEIVNAEPHKSKDWEWVDINDLPQKILPPVRSALGALKDNELFSEYDYAQISALNELNK